MAVRIRLKRMGSKKRPFYRIIATDSRNPRDGRFIETLGYYNPMTNPAEINIKEDLVYKWMERGAVPSENTELLLRKTGVLKKWSLLKKGVARDQLDAKYEELKSTETPPMSIEEREKIAEAKKAKAQAEVPDDAEAPAGEAEATSAPETVETTGQNEGAEAESEAPADEETKKEE